MPRSFYRRQINASRRSKFPKVFCLHKQPSIPEEEKSTSYFNTDKKNIHLEICVPSKKFYPYAILNTSYKNAKEITVLISDGTTDPHKPANKKDFILEIDFDVDNLQNSNVKPLKININDIIKIVIINDFFDFENNESLNDNLKEKEFESAKIIKSPEPKEDGEGVIIEGP